MRRILFICTGNYYRSRFAELLFATLARERGLAWEAFSRGTSVLTLGHHNVGPISHHARQALEARGIPVEDQPRVPLQLEHDDLLQADLIVAACDVEHRPLLEDGFPSAAERVARVEYLRVQDLAFTPPDEALAALDVEIRRLVERLSNEHAAARAEQVDVPRTTSR
jgi:protein-tyrosine phosphatase